MSIYTINSETELAGGAVADADELVVYDASTKVTKKVQMDSVRQYCGSGVVAIVATDALTPAEHANRTVTIAKLAGLTLTLPAATGTGDVYKIVVALTNTSSAYVIQVANATDEFAGTVIQTDADTSDTLASYPALDADGFDTVTMDGSTKGGIIGDMYTFTDIAAGRFLIEGVVTCTGTAASPLSAAVS